MQTLIKFTITFMCYTILVLIEKRMSKILKKIKVPKTDAVIFKRERSKYWYFSFYVGRCKT